MSDQSRTYKSFRELQDAFLDVCEERVNLKIENAKLHAELAEAKKDIERLRVALDRICSYPVHSEPVGGAYAMQDIAEEAIKAVGSCTMAEGRTDEDRALAIGFAWLNNSSIENWFPITAEELVNLRAELAEAKKRQHQSDLNYDALESQNTSLHAELDAAKKENAILRGALKRIASTRFGWEGDFGVRTIAKEAIEGSTEPAPDWLRERMEKQAAQPKPSLERVRAQLKASGEKGGAS